MTETQQKILFRGSAVCFLLFAFWVGLPALFLGAALALFGLGFVLGWEGRTNEEVDKFLGRIMPRPPDDDPPDKARV